MINYQDKGTPVHRLNPVTKLAWGGGLLVLSLVFNNPVYIMLFLLVIVLLVRVGGIWREWARLMKVSLWMGASIIVINALVSNHGAHVLLSAPFKIPVLGEPVVTLEAIAFGAMMALKLVVIISIFALINFTVHPDDIMSVMLKMKLPYKSVLVTSLSTRFVPCLLEDAERIWDAYRTRGVQLDAGSWLRRLKSRARITIPLLSNSLERAVQVAEAMEARAFGTGRNRTFYRDIKMTRIDGMTLGFVALPVLFGIFTRVQGYGDYQYYPTLEAISFGLLEGLLLLILALLLAAILPLAFIKRRLELD